MIKHKMKIDWYDGLTKHSNLLLLEKMWEESYGLNSTFYSYYMNPPKGKYSTLLYYVGEKLAGVLIFPHFKVLIDNVQWKNHGLFNHFDEEKRKYCSLGEIQLYVKPEFRKQGIAKNMIIEFSNELEDTVMHVKEIGGSDVIPVIQSVELAHTLTKKYLSNYVHMKVYGFEPALINELFSGVLDEFRKLYNFGMKKKSI